MVSVLVLRRPPERARILMSQLIERAGRPPEDEKVDQNAMDSWEELSLVSASPKLLKKGIEGVVMKQIVAAAKAQKGTLQVQNARLTQE